MPAISATAPGKVILFGEHAVVYDRPAIAVPVTQVKARTIITANPRGKSGVLHIEAPDIGLEADLQNLPPEDPIAAAIHRILRVIKVKRVPTCNLRITSTIPVAAGMGSGAAVTVSIIRALSAYLGHPIDDENVSAMAFEVDKLHHGTPSGIDNTVITYRVPVYFIRNQPIQTLDVPQPFTILIGDSGITSPTATTVSDVHHAWQTNRDYFETMFDAAGQIALAARDAIENGKPEALGPLMDNNHKLLQDMGVSSSELDLLVNAARSAGALGAKLSGGGRGGNMIAIVTPESAETVARSLHDAGAVGTIVSEVRK